MSTIIKSTKGLDTGGKICIDGITHVILNVYETSFQCREIYTNKMPQIISMPFQGHVTAYQPFRVVKVHYSNGDSITTEMASGLTDEQINDYFKIGRVFNVGSGDTDVMAKVVKTEILA